MNNDDPGSRRLDSQTLVHLLRSRAERQPQAVGYVYVQDGEPDERLTYSELDRRARTIALALRAAAPPGARAVLLYPPDLNYVTAFFGCLYAGMIAVPAYPPDPSRLGRTLPRLQAIIADARADVVLTTAPIKSIAEMIFVHAPELAEKAWIATDELSADPDAWRDSSPQKGDVAFLQYTSGSTGTPRGVVLTHGNLLHNLARIADAFEIRDDTVGVSWLPPYHDMGLIGGILAPMARGVPTALMSPIAFIQRPLRWLEAITRFGGTISGGPNFAYELCLRKTTEEDRAKLDLSTWRVAFSGAEPVRPDTLERFTEVFASCGFQRRAFYPCYGLAEATLLVAGGSVSRDYEVRRVDADALQIDRVRPPSRGGAERVLVGCGTVIADGELAVVDPRSGVRCAEGEIGEIWVRGPSVAQGYWRNPDETARTFGAVIAGEQGATYLRTGDLGFVDGGGLFVTGRLKDLVIIRGRNHYPQDIERTVEDSHGSVRRGCSAAFSVDVAGEEQLVVVMEIERRSRERRRAAPPGGPSERRSRDRREDDVNDPDHVTKMWLAAHAEPQPFDPEALSGVVRDAVLQHHDLHVYDIVLVQPGVLPKTSSGKIQRRECRRSYLMGTLESVASSRVRNLEVRRLSSLNVPATQAALDQLPRSERAGFIVSTLRDMVARALGVDPAQIDPSRPVSTMGLDSMVAVELAHQVERVFSVVVPVTWVLRGATIRELAVQLEKLRQERAVETVGVADLGDEQLSSGQQALWFLHQLAPESSAYNVHCALRVRSRVEEALLRGALSALLDRHRMLTSVYPSVDGRPRRLAGRHELALEVAQVRSEPERQALLEAAVHRPFDLSEGPLFRVHLISADVEDHTLLLVTHHIVADLWSLVVLLEEFGETYRALREGRVAEPIEQSATYDDYVVWQRSWLTSPAGARAWEYWSTTLADAPPALDLPFDRPRPPTQTYRGATSRFVLPRALARAAREVAQAEGTTLYGLLLATYEILLGRYTRSRDVTVGALVAGRSRAGLDSVVGYFVNPIVVRVDLGGRPSFREILSRVRTRLLDGLEHQDFPFPELVQRLRPDRDPSRTPLFQTVFVLEKARSDGSGAMSALVLGVPGATLDLGGLVVESTPIDVTAAQFDLTLNVVEHGDDIHGVVQFNRDLFDLVSIERLIEHFQALLGGFVKDPAAPIDAVSMLGAAEQQLLAARNPVATTFDREASVDDLVLASAARHPDATAVSGGGEHITYGHLVERAAGLAGDLSRLGVGPGSIVGVCMDRRPDLVVSLLGVMLTGAAYLPLDPEYPAERLRWMVEDSGVAVVLTDHRNDALAAGLGAIRTLPLVSWSPSADVGAARRPARGSGHRAYVIFTSGSTGRPKGVEVTHRSVVNFLQSMRERPGMTAEDVLLATTSLSFDIAGLELFLPLLSGAQVLMASNEEARDGFAIRRAIAERGVTVVQATPSAWRMLIAAGWEGGPIRALCGGEPLDAALASELRARCSGGLWNLYGPTETTIWSTSFEVHSDDVSLGTPIANTTVWVTDPGDGALLPIGVPGELCIGGSGLALGYLGRPAATAERFVPDPFDGQGRRLYRTGDLVRWRTDGRLEFLGRIDHQVKVRGHRIELGEIEAAVRQHPLVRNVVAVVAGAATGGTLVAYVVLDDPGATSHELREVVSRRLPEYMVPAAFVQVDAFPRTSNGKTDRKALAERPLPSSVGMAAAPRNPVERVVAAVWAEVLVAERVGIHDNFFELGGHSLLATRIAARLRELLQVDVPLRSVLQVPTVAGLSDAILASAAAPVAQANAEIVEELQEMTDAEAASRLVHGRAAGSRPT